MDRTLIKVIALTSIILFLIAYTPLLAKNIHLNSNMSKAEFQKNIENSNEIKYNDTLIDINSYNYNFKSPKNLFVENKVDSSTIIKNAASEYDLVVDPNKNQDFLLKTDECLKTYSDQECFKTTYINNILENSEFKVLSYFYNKVNKLWYVQIENQNGQPYVLVAKNDAYIMTKLNSKTFDININIMNTVINTLNQYDLIKEN